MAMDHRTKPPRTGDWEHFVLEPENSQSWRVMQWPPNIRNTVSSRLRGSLISAQVIRFFRSTLSEWDEKDEWRCWRFLGAGGFGTAACWVKTDEKGDRVDEVVLKEDMKRTIRYGPPGANSYYLSFEAWIQNSLNLTYCDNITHLRGYKAIAPQPQMQNPDPEVWRLYLEYAPYGDLGNLALRYKVFNRYLPELFLWHLFNSLARAILVMEDFLEEHGFVLHFDLKPDNVFLGYEQRRYLDRSGGLDGETVSFPTIKLGDFGLTRTIFLDTRHRVTDIGVIGTQHYQAPELRQQADDRRRQYGAAWNPPPNRPDDDLTPEVNVWNVGKVMYDVFSLSDAGNYDHDCAKRRSEYDRNGNEPLPNYDREPFSQDVVHDRSPYRKELSALIQQCMHVEPSRRPTARQLYDATRVEMEHVYGIPPGNSRISVRDRRMYYRGNEINNMPIEEKNCKILPNVHGYSTLLEPGQNDPDEPPLEIDADQFWEYEWSTGAQDGRRKLFDEAMSRERSRMRFRDRILENKKRVRDLPQDIRFLDPDLELTYEGTWYDEIFIGEASDDDHNGGGGGGNGGGGGANGNGGVGGEQEGHPGSAENYAEARGKGSNTDRKRRPKDDNLDQDKGGSTYTRRQQPQHSTGRNVASGAEVTHERNLRVLDRPPPR